MKKWSVYFIVGIAILIVTGCDMTGDDGKAFLTVYNGTSGVSLYASADGFPDNWSLGSPYEIDSGTMAVQYAMCYQEYNDTNARYQCYINSSDYYYYSDSAYDTAAALAYYLTEDEDGGQVYSVSFTVTVKEGEEGTLFKKGSDGADTQYTMTLYWNPNDITVTAEGAEMTKSLFTEDGITTLQFSDEYRIFTITIPEFHGINGAKEFNPSKN